MWRSPRILVALLASVLLTAGCLHAQDMGGGEENPDGEDRESTPPGGEGPSGTGGTTDNGEGDPGDDEDKKNGEESEEEQGDGDGAACYGQEKNDGRHPPAPPNEQEVTAREDVRCPAHYFIENAGTGPEWEVPTWAAGAWWQYENHQLSQYGYTCHEQVRESVNGTGENRGVPIYRVQIERSGCDGEHATTYGQDRTQSSLSEFAKLRWEQGDDDGYINHERLFPIRDGRSWAFMTAGGFVTEVTASHAPGFLFQGEPVEAWHVHMVTKQGSNTWTKDQWYGVGAKNLLREEFRANELLIWFTDLTDFGTGP